MKYISKRNYEITRNQYLSWVKFIRFITFGKVDLTEAMEEVLSEFVVLDL